MSDPKKRDGDLVKFGDAVEVGISQYVVPPRNPCPTCSVETKDTGIRGWHICTDCDKRVYIGLTEKQHLELLDELNGAKARVQQFEIMYRQADTELTVALKTLRERGII